MAKRGKGSDAMRTVQSFAPDAQGDVRAVFGEAAGEGARPLRIVARMRGPVTGAPMIDGLLASVVAQRAGLVAGFGPIQRIEIPIVREPGGRFHLATGPLVAYDSHELRWVNRKFPLGEAQMFGDAKLKRIPISAGPCKSYRIPHEVAFALGDKIAWYCVGDADPVRALLECVTHLGRRRAVGRGAVASWEVVDAEPWDGFPVVQDGKPLRPLPVDWPGVDGGRKVMHTLTYPYWEHAREELCVVP